MKLFALLTMKSKRCLDEICYADEIKSVPEPDKVGFHHEVISPIKDGFIPSARTDLVKKVLFFRTGLFSGTDTQNGTGLKT